MEKQMEAAIGFRVYIGVIWGCIGIVEKNMEITRGFRVEGQGN